MVLLAMLFALGAISPAVAMPAPAPQASGGFWYIVDPGDTLTFISTKYDVSIEGIMKANKLTTQTLRVGQKLWLPREAGSPKATPVPTPEPPAPKSAKGKIVYISLTKQHMWAYDTGRQVYSFVISSGLPDRPTKPGTFRVLSKIPTAWSNIWQLSMPWWMGIYYAGRVENGIHALPINKRGIKLWAGLLGRPASFGCIILNTKDAKTLFDWVDLGTMVIIRY